MNPHFHQGLDYRKVRRIWAQNLEESGELRDLETEERDMLERGSLDVLRWSRLKRLQRQVRVSRTLVAGLLGGLLLVLIVFGPSRIAPSLSAEDLEAGLMSVRLLPLAMLGAFVLALVSHLRLARRVVKRQQLYTELGHATEELARTLN